jgi:hypothetical protein
MPYDYVFLPRKAHHKPVNLVNKKATEKEEDNNDINFSRPFGADSFIRMDKYTGILTIKAHGTFSNTGHFKAKKVAAIIREYLASLSLTEKNIRQIRMLSCFARAGGPFSQAQALSNIFNVKVKGVRGYYSEDIVRNNPNSFSFVEPYSSTIASNIANKGNKLIYHMSETMLRVSRSIRHIMAKSSKKPYQDE